MKPKRLISAAQAAWLNEVGVDTHWLGITGAPVGKAVPAKSAPNSLAPDVPTYSASAQANQVTAQSTSAQTTSASANVAGDTDTPVQHANRAPSTSLPVSADQASSTPRQTNNAVDHFAEITAKKSALLDAINSVTDINSLNKAISSYIQLLEPNSRLVLGSGHMDQPKYMFIGEQPGLDDSMTGKPFSGDQGKLLANIFKSVALPQADSSYKTHLLKYRLSNGASPNSEQITENLQLLKREIELIQPQNIIALGSIAASALLNIENLKELRGQMHYYQCATGQIPFWISHQPVALLVHGARKEQVWRDFVAIAIHNSDSHA